MRSFCFIVYFTLTLALCAKAEQASMAIAADSCARFEVIGEKLLEVGDIESSLDTITASFWLKSTGDIPMIIVSNTTSCPCTHVTYDKDIIEPGDSVNIVMTYELRSHIGRFLQSVLLKTNTFPENYVHFYIEGNVIDVGCKEHN
jgi:hypothetical protein